MIFRTILLSTLFVFCFSCNEGVRTRADRPHENIIEFEDTNVNKTAIELVQEGLNIAKLDQDTLGDWQKAIEFMDLAIDKDPQYALAYHYRGQLNLYIGNRGDAMEDLNRAIELDPEFEESYFIRASIFIGAGNDYDAMTDYNKIIELNPKNGRAYECRAYNKLNTQDNDGACADFKEAKKNGYTSPQMEILSADCE